MTLKEAMEKRGWTAAELARRSGCSEATVSLLINRKRKGMPETWKKLARPLGVAWWKLVPKGGE